MISEMVSLRFELCDFDEIAECLPKCIVWTERGLILQNYNR
jgi:hypothetical protein